MEFVQLKSIRCSLMISRPLVGLDLECGGVKCLRNVGDYLPTLTLSCSLTEDFINIAVSTSNLMLSRPSADVSQRPH